MKARWRNYDPAWLVALAREQVPELVPALEACTRVREGQLYLEFLEWDARMRIALTEVLKDSQLGVLVIDVLTDGRIRGVELLDRALRVQGEPRTRSPLAIGTVASGKDAVTISGAIPFHGQPFRCLLWDHVGGATEALRRALSLALLESGCRYLVCGGADCEAWHDTMDDAWLHFHRDDLDAALESAHVMTTWHRGESPSDVAWFLAFCAHGDDPGEWPALLLHVGDGPDRKRLELALQRLGLECGA